MAVDFNDIPVKQDQGLGIHGHVVYAHIGSLKAVWKADHHNAVHGRIVTLKGKLGPLPHLRLCVLHFPAAKVKVSDLRVILLYHILVLFSLFFVMGKTDPHSLAAGNRFLNALPQHLPVQIDLNSQAGADI